jgi:protein-L-isoaspartate(D-aspartate) O-methyltransferase
MDRQPAAADAFATARNIMVDSQVRPNKVSDPRIIAAMRTLPRERFVPKAQAALAYADSDIPLGAGRVLLEPMAIARLVQLAALRGGEQVLVVGAGPGYGAALLAACGARVTALEEDATLLGLARAALSGIAGVTLVEGPLAAGWPAGAPYDVVFIEGAVEDIPPSLTAQLRGAASRLITVRAGAGGRIGQAVLGEMTPAGLSLRPEFDCMTQVLPALRRQPGFVF